MALTEEPQNRDDSGPDPGLLAAVTQWKERGRVADLLGPTLAWLLDASQGERAAFFTLAPGGGYRSRASRNLDGESVGDLERWISHFAVQRAVESREPRFFEDTRKDRRFRTEAEIELGMRTRSILVIPIVSGGEIGVFYADSRFRPMQEVDETSLSFRLARDLVSVALQWDGLRARNQQLERRIDSLERRQERVEVEEPVVAPRPRIVRETVDFHGFLTRSAELASAIEDLESIAPSEIPVLISGESGTGKEVLARAIHEESGRKGPFLSLHCGSIPRNLVEIELFGHTAGAFTGASKERSGLIEAAANGTIFLDDVEEMVPEMQTALLRVLQSRTFRRVSDTEEREAKVRVISATRTSADGRIAELRTDLYYRLAGFAVHLPPLRDRREDVLLLIDHFLSTIGPEETPLELPDEVRGLLATHDWPGNVRELQNLVQRLVTLADPSLVPERVREYTGGDLRPTYSSTDVHAVVEQAEKQAILEALEKAEGNKSAASKLLGLSRKTLYRRLEKYRIPL